MFGRPVKETSAEFTAETSSLDRARTVTSEALAETRLSSKEINQVALALEEALTNIIRHSYLGSPGAIKLKVVSYPSRIVISLLDYGRPYFPEAKDQVSLARLVETSRKGGLGQMMIQRLMDDVEYIVGDGYNELRMTKLLPRWYSAANTMRGRTLGMRARFTIATGFVVALIVGGSFFYMEDRVIDGIRERQREAMRNTAESTAALAGSFVLNRRTFVEFDELAISMAAQSSDIARITIIDSVGSILADSRDIKLLRKPYAAPDGAPDGAPEGEIEIALADTEALHDARYLRVPISARGASLGSVAVIYGQSSIAEQLATARTETLTLLLLEALVGLLGIYLLSNYFVRPVKSITEQVRRFSDGISPGELPVDGAAEFFEISRALNSMMTRIRKEDASRYKQETLEREIQVASEIQRNLLPQELPRIPGLDIGAYYRAASLVGGDLYDVIEIGENQFCLAIADVSGKGVPASLVMSVLNTTLRFVAPGCPTAGEILEKVEARMVSDIPSGVFITLALAVYDARTREISYVSAGHNPLIHYSGAERGFRMVNPRGAPLGLSGLVDGGAGRKYEQERFALGEDHFLCLYTDGLSEAVNSAGAALGPEGLAEFLQKSASEASSSETESGARAQNLVGSLIERLDEYRAGKGPEDDMTVIIGAAPVSTVSESAVSGHSA